MSDQLPEPHWAPGYQGFLPEGAYSAEQVREAVRRETERCASLAERMFNRAASGDEIAEAIRARSGETNGG